MLLNEIKLPVQKRSKERLEIVIATAISILETRGINACTIPEIAFISNIPKTYIYQYFTTINHLYIVIIQRYLDALQTYVSFRSETYHTWTVKAITANLITKVTHFYNSNKAASILILGGPVNVEGFNLQEIVIEKISSDLAYLFSHKKNPLNFNQIEDLTYLVEIVFALMKHSFYKYHYITSNIQKESIFLSDTYLIGKGYQIET
ncbi:TetR/AcrR family transcriptional regulator [Acinetobacter silvestris]|uniref:HTH tetR-type domain-containing protein n=1 Tax=Acinetobacter silvestris TaxID=1977882 RepID=A0A1Y3CGY6_9GAMM|nr:TetR/AcrR family transcriptional regulator [Acinetobacter silvestris]OTG65172.1 hypothetical protein B9T28_10320 [Acinetobacter silvestris]